MNRDIQDFSARVCGKFDKTKNPEFDILTIIMIAQIVMKLISMWQECQEKPEVTKLNGSQKALGLREIKKSLPFGKKLLARNVLKGILNEAAETEQKDLKKLLDTPA